MRPHRHGGFPDAQGYEGGGSNVLSHGERGAQEDGLTCKQAISAILLPGLDDCHRRDFVAFFYPLVRRKWRTLYESQPRSFANEPISNQVGPSKRTLPRDIAIPTARRLVRWAIHDIKRRHEAQLLFMQAAGAPLPTPSLIAEIASIEDAAVSGDESDA